MIRGSEYYANYGNWDIEDYVNQRILNNEYEIDRFSKTIDLVPAHTKSLLDIGAGLGVFLNLLHEKKGIKGIGTEITPLKIRTAEKMFKVKLLNASASSLPSEDLSFEVVTALELLEHLPYPDYKKSLLEIQRVAQKSIVISVPFEERRTFIPCPYCKCKFNPNYHNRSFSKNTIASLFDNFELVKLVKIGPTVLHTKIIDRLLSSFRSKPYPEFAVCPSCGYKKKPTSEISKEPLSDNGKNHFKKYLGKIFLKVFGQKSFRHVLALYTRK